MTEQSKTTTGDQIEQRAREIYHEIGFVILVGDPATSWERDRLDVRERFRKMAREELNVEG